MHSLLTLCLRLTSLTMMLPIPEAMMLAAQRPLLSLPVVSDPQFPGMHPTDEVIPWRRLARVRLPFTSPRERLAPSGSMCMTLSTWTVAGAMRRTVLFSLPTQLHQAVREVSLRCAAHAVALLVNFLLTQRRPGTLQEVLCTHRPGKASVKCLDGQDFEDFHAAPCLPATAILLYLGLRICLSSRSFQPCRCSFSQLSGSSTPRVEDDPGQPHDPPESPPCDDSGMSEERSIEIRIFTFQSPPTVHALWRHAAEDVDTFLTRANILLNADAEFMELLPVQPQRGGLLCAALCSSLVGCCGHFPNA